MGRHVSTFPWISYLSFTAIISPQVPILHHIFHVRDPPPLPKKSDRPRQESDR